MPRQRPMMRARQRAGAVAAIVALSVAFLGVGQSPAMAAGTATDWSSLQAAIGGGGTVVLGADITNADSELVVPSGTPVTLDLNGHALTLSNSNTNQAGIRVARPASFTVTDSVGTGVLTVTVTSDPGGAAIGGRYLEASGAITIAGGTVDVTGGRLSAGIGSGAAAESDPIAITGGTVTARGGEGGAGIGGSVFNPGSSNPPTGAITISGGTVVAIGGIVASGIGGGQAQPNGPILISGGTVTATGGNNGPGIGSGFQNGNPGGNSAGNIVMGEQITVTGGVVTATGGAGGAGIGGGVVAGGSPLTVTGGSVTAVAASAPAVGGGSFGGAGSDVNVQAGGSLTLTGPSVIGGGTTWGSFANAGTVTIPAGSNFAVPVGEAVLNSGTINLNGSLTGAGLVTNTGRIIGTGTVAGNGQGGGSLLVTGHNYLLNFDLNGASGAAPADRAIFSTSVADAGFLLPTPPSPAGYTFLGWYTAATGGAQVLATSDLSTLFGAAGPVAPDLFAHWSIAQAISFTSIPPASAVVGDDYVVAASGGGSGNAVTFASATPAVCSVSGADVTFDHVGTCTIRADQAAGGSYAAAPSATQDIVVGPAPQAITFTSTPPSDATVGDGYVIAASGGGSGNAVTFASATPAVCTVSGADVTFDHVGTCTIRADQAAGGDYAAAPSATQDIVVDPAPQAISFTSTPPSDATVGQSYQLAATGGASGLAVTFASATPAVCTVSGSTVTFAAAGTCTIEADQAGDADYLAAATTVQTVTVAAAVAAAAGLPSTGAAIMPLLALTLLLFAAGIVLAQRARRSRV